MPTTLPLVAAAFICERILQEGDVFSAIRIVDTYTTKTIALTPVPHGERVPVVNAPKHVVGTVLGSDQPVLDMSALVMVRAGDLRGKHEITVEMEGPDGTSVKHPEPFRVDFAKDDPAESAALKMRFVLAGNSPVGRYWVHVFWDGERLTKIPVKLVRESESPEPQAPQSKK